MATALTIITGALDDLGLRQAGQAVSSEDAEDARTALNQMADALGIERLTLYARVRTVQALTASTASYTIGSGATIDIPRPAWIDGVRLIQDNAAAAADQIELPLRLLTQEQYETWPMKSYESSQPTAVYYDYSLDSSGYGLIYPLPIPDVGTTSLVLYTPGGHVSSFADLTTNYILPRGLERALRKNLALEVAPMFDVRNVSPILVQQAEHSKTTFKQANVRPLVQQLDPALTAGARGKGYDDAFWGPPGLDNFGRGFQGGGFT